MWVLTRRLFVIQHIKRYKSYNLYNWWKNRSIFHSIGMARWQRTRLAQIKIIGKFKVILTVDKKINKFRKD
jgi:hypothetical protein